MSKKQLKKTSASKNFYLTLIYYLKRGFSPSQICKKLGLSQQRLSYYLKPLKINGIVRKIGYGVWEINKEKLQNYHWTNNLKKSSAVDISSGTLLPKNQNIRGHAFQFVLKIPELNNWEHREEYLIKQNISFKRIGSNWVGQRIDVHGHKVWLTPRSVVVYAPDWKSWFAESGKNAKSHAIYDLLEICKRVERMLNVSFKHGKGYKFKVARQHYSIVRNSLAIQYNREGKKLYVITDRGLIFLIDDSHSLKEFEGVHSETASEDTEKANDFFQSLDRNPITVDTILQGFNRLTASVQQIVNAQTIEQQRWSHYGEKIEAHTGAMENLEVATSKLEQGIDKFVTMRGGNTVTPKGNISPQQIIDSCQSFADLLGWEKYINLLPQETKKELKRLIALKFGW